MSLRVHIKPALKWKWTHCWKHILWPLMMCFIILFFLFPFFFQECLKQLVDYYECMRQTCLINRIFLIMHCSPQLCALVGVRRNSPCCLVLLIKLNRVPHNLLSTIQFIVSLRTHLREPTTMAWLVGYTPKVKSNWVTSLMHIAYISSLRGFILLSQRLTASIQVTCQASCSL